jgi:hypothetical protein
MDPPVTQTAARRLLTEAAAAATYRTAAQVTAAAQAAADGAAAASIPLVQKGAASGVATLGADGKVTAAQLPPATSLFGAVKAATTTRTATTLAADPDLVVTLGVGTYWVEVEGTVAAGASAVTWQWGFGGGGAAFTVPADAGQISYTAMTNAPQTSQTLTQGAASGWTIALAANGLAAVRISVPLVVTTAGTVALLWAPTTGVQVNLRAGARLRAQKVA